MIIKNFSCYLSIFATMILSAFLAGGELVYAYEGKQDTPFTMLIMNDPQYPWLSVTEEIPYGSSELNAFCSTSFDQVATRLRDGELDASKEEQCEDSRGQKAEWDGKSCTWTWDSSVKKCAAKLEQNNRIEAMLAFETFGTWRELASFSEEPNRKPIDRPVGIIINGDLTANFERHEFEVYKELFVTGSDIKSIPVLAGLGNHDYENNIDYVRDHPIKRSIGWMREMITGARVSNFPAYWVQSYDPDSLSYSWSYGEYVFIQLHNSPLYKKTYSKAEGFNISRSISWLTSELQKATAAGKKIVLLDHMWPLFSGDEDDEDRELGHSAEEAQPVYDAIEASNTVAVFSGHLVGCPVSLGKNSSNVRHVSEKTGEVINQFGNTIPIFRGGHSGQCGHHKFLLVEFGSDYFTVALIDGLHGTFRFNRSHDETQYSKHDISINSTRPTPPYGFAAIGIPLEDVPIEGDTHTGGNVTTVHNHKEEEDAGAVNIFYTNKNGGAYAGDFQADAHFEQQWTQGQGNLTASKHFSSSVESDDQHGYALVVGDFNGDNFPDLASGAPYEDSDTADDYGIVSVVYGNVNGLRGEIQVLSQGSGTESTPEEDDYFGFSLASGDFNNDGYDDLAVGVPGEDIGICDETGAINIFYGSKTGLSADEERTNILSLKDVKGGCDDDEKMGWSLAVGNFNGDLYDDLAVGVPLKDSVCEEVTASDTGAVIQFYGDSDGLEGNIHDKGVVRILTQCNIGSSTFEDDDQFGWSLAAGDFNGDGKDDIAVGVPFEDNNCAGVNDDGGAVQVFYSDHSREILTQCSRTDMENEENDNFGYSLAAGNFGYTRDQLDNGEARIYEDLAVGVPFEDIGDADDAGAVATYHGSSSGLVSSVIAHQGNLKGAKAEEDDQFGFTLAAGDADQDGWDELAIGAPGENNDIGIVHIMWGPGFPDVLFYESVTHLWQDDSNPDSISVTHDNGVQGFYKLKINDGTEPDTGCLFTHCGDRLGEALAITPLYTDITPPEVNYRIHGTPGEPGWYISHVILDWLVKDLESNIFSPDCKDRNISYNTLGETITCTAESTGGSSTESVNIKVDFNAPIVNFELTPAASANANGWYNSLFSVTAVGEDIISGINACGLQKDGVPTPHGAALLTEGVNSNYGATCFDKAGNSASILETFKIDIIAPSVQISTSPEAPSQYGWYNSDVLVSFAGTDALSGIDFCTKNFSFTLNGAGHSASGKCTDLAGNESVKKKIMLNIDKILPSASSSREPLANSAGWNNTDVTVNFSGSDSLSGLESCTAEKTLSTEGAGQSVSGICTDRAGNERNTTASDINIDKTMPTASNSRMPLANSAGWNNTDVTVNFSGSDSLSGLDSCTEAKVLSTEGAGQSASGKCTDLAGNNSVLTTASDIYIDKTIPQANANGPYSVIEGSAINLVSTGTIDVLSGVARTAWALDNDNLYNDGDPATFQGIDDSINPVSLKVIDQAGNEAIVQTEVKVNNFVPIINLNAGGNSSINENGMITLSGNIIDQGRLDTFKLVVNWGEGDPAVFDYPAGTKDFSLTHQYIDDDPTNTSSDTYPIVVSVTDDDGGSDSANTSVIVNNVDPVASVDSLVDVLTGLSISYVDRDGNVVAGKLKSVIVGTEVAMVGNYTDTSPRDIHWAPAAADPTVDWGDGVIDTITIPLANRGPSNPEGASGTTEAAHHTYAPDSSGDYIIGLTITDDDTGFDESTATIAVVSAAEAVQDSVDDLLQLIQDPAQDEDAMAAVQDSVDALNGSNDGLDNNGALDKLETENNNAALDKLLDALMALEAAEAADNSLDLSTAKTQLVLTAKSVAVDAIDRASMIASKPNEQNKIAQAEAGIVSGDAALGQADYVVALTAYADAAQAVQGIK